MAEPSQYWDVAQSPEEPAERHNDIHELKRTLHYRNTYIHVYILDKQFDYVYPPSTHNMYTHSTDLGFLRKSCRWCFDKVYSIYKHIEQNRNIQIITPASYIIIHVCSLPCRECHRYLWGDRLSQCINKATDKVAIRILKYIEGEKKRWKKR